MAVYKRSYRPYEGSYTPDWARMLVLPRYAFANMLDSRLLIAFLMAASAWPVVSIVMIYLNHNLSTVKLMGWDIQDVLPIDALFFLRLLSVQSFFGFLLTAFIGPGLIAPDLSNNALPLYFSRPINRAEYVVGKMLALVLLLSAVTWIPGLLLFLLQSSYAGWSWFWQNGWIARAVFFGSFIWIVVMSLLALALSAWVKWRIAATALMFGVFFVAAGFGEVVNNILFTNMGSLINIGFLMSSLWTHLFHLPEGRSVWSEFFGVPGRHLPLWDTLLALFGICIVCLVLLERKVRAREVVR